VLKLVDPAPRLAADEQDAKELERLRLALTAACSPGRGEAPELQQQRLGLVQLTRKLLEPLAHRGPLAAHRVFARGASRHQP